MTPQILGNLSSYGVERIAGFSSLSAEDKGRVRLAIRNQRVDPADVIESHPVSQPSQVTATQLPPPSPRKRKADAIPGPSRVKDTAAPSPTQAAARQAAIGGTAWEEGADAEDVADQQVDELYCTLSSNVVGIQYYKGGPHYLIYTIPSKMTFAWQASLTLVNKSSSSENRATNMTGNI